MSKFTVTRQTKTTCAWTVGDDFIIGTAKPTVKLFNFAKQHGLDVNDLVEAGKTALKEPKPEAPKIEPQKLWGRVRLIDEEEKFAKSVSGDSAEALLREMLKHKANGESVFKFGPKSLIAALDVDYHHIPVPPSETECLRFCALLQPRPFAIWVTHGNGIRAFFGPEGHMSAEEMASCAALFMKHLDPRCKAEILDTSRHPLSVRTKNGETQRCSQITWVSQSIGGIMSLWGGESTRGVSDEDIHAWLEEHGLTFGRHDHNKCPIGDPVMQTGAPPVMVTPDGVKCFRCAGMGHETNGYVTWERLIQGRTTPRIVQAAKSWVHWEHARLIMLEDYGSMGMSERVLQKSYSALLKLLNDPNDPRIRAVFDRFGAIRSAQDTWLDPVTLRQILPAPSSRRFESHPACLETWQDDDGNWKRKTDFVAVDNMVVVQRLPNWPGVTPVRGARIWGEHRHYSSREVVRALVKPKYPVRYLPPERRATPEQIDAAIRKSFPMMDVDYLRLLIVARGHAEYGRGRPPLIVATGPTGCGKTQTLEFAAHIIGDEVASIAKNAKFDLALGQALGRGGFVLFDEFAKNPSWSPERRSSEFDRFLPIGEDFPYRELYVGTISVPVRSVLLIANNAYGAEVTEHKQFGRRAVHVQLNRSVPADRDWTKTCGTGSLGRWRSNPDNAHIADSLLSEVIDTFFGPQVGRFNTFEEDAEALGFYTFAASRDDESEVSHDSAIRKFFALLRKHPEETQRDRLKSIDLSKLDLPIVEAWANIADRDTKGHVSGSSIKLAEASLVDVLGVECEPDEGVFVTLRKRGSRLYVRFKLGKNRRSNGPVNEEIPLRENHEEPQ